MAIMGEFYTLIERIAKGEKFGLKITAEIAEIAGLIKKFERRLI
jgi:hypothetical protein